MADLMGIELARPGTWPLKSGPITVTPRHLDDAARFANREDARPPYLKIGHTDTRFMASDGEPALGWVHNVRVEEDEVGHVLKGDITGMPDWLAEAVPRHWPDRSMEGWEDYTHEDGEKYSLIMHGLALLGVTPPGMASIKSLRDLPAALGLPVSASGRRIVASFGDPTTSAATAEIPSNKGAGMVADPVKIREALGLDPDASDDDVMTAGRAEFPPPEGTSVVASAIPSGMIVIASSVWDENQKTMKTLNAFVAKTKRDERDEVLTKAVQAGKFTPAQKQQFSEMWDANPDLARKFIDIMTPNSALSVMASGYAGDAEMEEDELDREIDRLSGPNAKVA